ncbi:MAG: hypothetical protein WCH84_02850 [Verrucomicrobiota bacterium]
MVSSFADETVATVQQFSFWVPATLQHASSVIGCDYQVCGQWIVRAELQPGVYSDFAEVTGGDVNALFVLATILAQTTVWLNWTVKRLIVWNPGLESNWCEKSRLHYSWN